MKGPFQYRGQPSKGGLGHDGPESAAIGYVYPDYGGASQRAKGLQRIIMRTACVLGSKIPSCWDRRNVDSEDHKAHMAYRKQVSGSHPYRLVVLKMEMVFDTTRFDYEDGDQPFRWANGDTTGIGLLVELMGFTCLERTDFSVEHNIATCQLSVDHTTSWMTEIDALNPQPTFRPNIKVKSCPDFANYGYIWTKPNTARRCSFY